MIKGFSLSYSKGSAWLTVFPREEGDRKVYSDEVQARMKILRVPPVRANLIEEIIQGEKGIPVELGPWPGGEALSTSCAVEIAPDGMSAYLTAVQPRPGGEEITVEMVYAALKEKGVSRGIDEAGVRKFVDSRIYGRKVKIACGAFPVHGKGSRVRYHFVTEHVPYRELLYGRIDLRELNYIQNRKEGDVLADLQPEQLPVNGYKVTGEVLPADPADEGETLNAGEGCTLEEGRILALQDGNARLEGNVIVVEPVVTVQNVDYETGNISFSGSVVVKGTVADGFSVTAGGDLEVEKCVGRVTLTAGRNIILKQGINGDNDAEVRAGGSLMARYGESSSLVTGGDLIIKEALMHCSLMVKGNLLLSGGRAELLGGTAVVRGSLLCRKLGGIYEPATSVIMGIDPDDLDAYRKLLTNLEAKRLNLNELDRKIGLLRKGNGEQKEKLQQAETQLQGEAEKLNGEIQEMTARSHEMGRSMVWRSRSLLAAQDRIYGGVHITFGFLEYTGNAGGKGVPSTVLYRQGDVILDKGFDPSHPPEIEPVSPAEEITA